jgi:hypothetical protein
MRDRRELDHELMNCLSIILGFADLIIQESTPDDPRRADFLEIQRAAQTAVGLLAAKEDGGS